MVHRRGFRGTERGKGHGWYTTMGTGVRNVWKEGFIHKMKPHQSQHAADETGVRRKRRRKKRWKRRRRKGLRWKGEKEERAEGSILSRAEDGGTDADDGGSVADGKGPVVGHSDGKFGEVCQLRVADIQFLFE